ncbi:MAG: hypothetical protein J6D00_07735 [Christensenellaceae bacterium]|nr:hypothetical protein [Christensenellaceae bacterium]
MMTQKTYKLMMIAAAVILVIAIAMGLIFGGFSKGIDFTGGVVITMLQPLEKSAASYEEELKAMPETLGNLDLIISDATNTTIIYIAKVQEISVDLETFKARLEEEFVTPVNDIDLAVLHECEYIGPIYTLKDCLMPALALFTALLVAAIYLMIRYGISAAISMFTASVASPILMLALLMIIRIDISKNIISACFLSAAVAMIICTVSAIISAYRDRTTDARKSTREEIRKMAQNELTQLLLISGVAFVALAAVGMVFQTRLMRELLVAYILGAAMAVLSSYWAMSGLRMRIEKKKR